jgi:hypothetical protein
MDAQTKKTNQTKRKLWIDALIFIAFLVAMDPRSSGLAVHEWLSLSMIFVLIVHLLLNWDWIAQVTRRFFGKMKRQSRLNYILNWLTFIDGTLIMVSGIMISEVALYAMGVALPKNFAWRGLHDASANLFLILLGLHTALHWTWIVNAVRRYVFQPIGALLSFKTKEDASL